MIDEPDARKLARARLRFDDVRLGEAQELADGWYFPWQTERVGCNGVIVNKRTGRVLELGSAFPVARDLALYDRGYQSRLYDLVILRVIDVEATQRALARLRIPVVEPTYEHGQVWRVARQMPDRERWRRLENLPSVFPALTLYFDLEVLEEARLERWFDFEALPFHPAQAPAE